MGGPAANQLGGTVYRFLGELERAEDASESALARGDLRAAATAWNNLGLIYEIRFEPQRSLDAYNRALEIWKILGERSREAATLNNLGMVYAALGRTSEAADLLRQALFLRRNSLPGVGGAADRSLEGIPSPPPLALRDRVAALAAPLGGGRRSEKTAAEPAPPPDRRTAGSCALAQ